MTDDQALAWLRANSDEAAMSKLEHFVRLLLTEAEKQSLIARSTFRHVWSRHIADSAQLVALASNSGLWIDVGSGGGLPGLVVAILRQAPVLMVEPRRKRVDFLRAAIVELDLPNASVVQGNIQSLDGQTAAVLSARAVSNMIDIFQWTANVVSRETQFLLPRGENAVSDLDGARHAWQGTFHVEQSITDPSAGIIVATQVRPR